MFENVEVFIKAVQENEMIEKLESGLLLIKPELIISEENVIEGGEALDLLSLSESYEK